jgi:hypothetical protein
MIIEADTIMVHVRLLDHFSEPLARIVSELSARRHRLYVSRVRDLDQAERDIGRMSGMLLVSEADRPPAVFENTAEDDLGEFAVGCVADIGLVQYVMTNRNGPSASLSMRTRGAPS